MDPRRSEMVGEPAGEQLSSHIAAGTRRVVLWGSPGAARATLLAHLAESTDAHVLDAPTTEEAHRALANARPDQTTVVGSVGRADLEADAYVEIDRLSPSGAFRFLCRLLASGGAAVEDDEPLRRIARHVYGHPALARRAASQLRVLSPEVLADRCDAALGDLLRFGTATGHPLWADDWRELVAALPLSERASLVALLAGGESVPMAAAESLVSAHSDRPPIETLVALRDIGALVSSGTAVEPSPPIVAALLRHDPALAEVFVATTERLDRDLAVAARSAHRRWLVGGDRSAEPVQVQRRKIRRATERTLGRLAREEHSELAERLVTLVLGLRALAEPESGAVAEQALIEAAIAALGADPIGQSLELARARLLRLAGNAEALEEALASLSVEELDSENRTLWHAERAHLQRHRRDLEGALEHMRSARESATSLGWRHREARYEIDLGALRYWQERIPDAIEHFERGRSIAAALGARRAEGIALTNLCLCFGLLGDESRARSRGLAAIERFRAEGDRGAWGTALGHLGLLALQYGRLKEAEEHLLEAERKVADADYFEQLRFSRFNRAECLLAAGRLEEARALADDVEQMVVERPDPLVALALAGLNAELFEHDGRWVEALQAIDEGLEHAHAASSADGIATLEALRTRLLARIGEANVVEEAALRSEAALEAAPRLAVRVAARLTIEHARRLVRIDGDLGPLAEALRPSWEGLEGRRQIGVSAVDSIAVRNCARAFWTDLAPEERAEVERLARWPNEPCVCVDARRAVAWLPDGKRLEGRARRNAFQLLVALTDAPFGCSRDELIARLWPNEQIVPRAAHNRLHNAVAQLRATALGAHVVRDGEHYRLDRVRVIRLGAQHPF